METRFRDYETCLSAFEKTVWIECPHCDQAARSVCLDRGTTWRFTCLHCAYTNLASRKTSQRRSPSWKQNHWWTQARTYGGAVDPWLGLPLWLRVPCCGQMLWAYNADHLDFLEHYVQATLRERQGRKGNHHSIAVCLPRWMKLAKHRETILKAIRQLKAKTKAID